jgi:predicted DsbA family dithiol-disulfide isomerase
MEAAMKQTDSCVFTVRWHPFLLRPNMPLGGIEKAPDTPENPRVNYRMKQIGVDVGIDFTGKCDRSPNTVLAHCLLDFALSSDGPKKQNEVQELIFNAYFTLGIYPDLDNLLKIASEASISTAQAKKHMIDPEIQTKVAEEARVYSQQGVNGVPYFFVNGEPLFSGAQDVNKFVEAFARVS